MARAILVAHTQLESVFLSIPRQTKRPASNREIIQAAIPPKLSNGARVPKLLALSLINNYLASFVPCPRFPRPTNRGYRHDMRYLYEHPAKCLGALNRQE